MGFLDEIIDEDRSKLHIDQGSDDWEQIRIGRATSSEYHNLMTFGYRPMTETELKARPKSGKGSQTKRVIDTTQLGDKAHTYIRQKVAEVFTGLPKRQSYAYPLVYGKETEPMAVEHFEKITGLKTEQVGFQVYTDHAGGSPDRMIPEIKGGLEIKCPLEDAHQIDYMMLTDHYTLKLNYPAYYWQCVSLMLFTGSERWIFGAFNPRMIADKHKFYRVDIEAKDVAEDMDAVAKALEVFVEEKLKLIKLLS